MIRLILATAILFHGLCHFAGFAAAFGLVDSMRFHTGISEPVGVIWLSGLLLFTVTAQLSYMKKDWWLIGFAAILVSELLIVSVWSDAKYGTVANAIIFIYALYNFAGWRFMHTAKREATELLKNITASEKILKDADLVLLPVPVKNWITSCGAVGRPVVRSVRLKQKGALRMSTEAQWMRMVAEQYFTIAEPSFVWLSHIRYGFTHIAGRDEFRKGRGRMLIKVASIIPVADASGMETDQGTMLRFLAEIQWFPSAAISPLIKWRAIDAISAEATMTYNGVSVKGIFFFNEMGDIVAFEADRYMETNGRYSLEKWYVPVSEYSVFEGVRVPSKGGAVWKLKSGDFNWFNWEIAEVNYNMPVVY